MSITIKEIAKLAGTSRATVDRVIHNRGNVNKDLEEKIKKIIKETNFTVNEFGRGLVNLGKKFHIYLIINSIGNEFFETVLNSMIATASQFKNITLVIDKLKGYNEKEQVKSIKKAKNNSNIDLLIITPINSEQVINELKDIEIPIITVNNDLEIERLAFVGCNYINSGEIAGDLAKLTLNKDDNILIVAGSFKLIGHKQRVSGFQSNLNKYSNNYHFDVIENEDDDLTSYNIVKQHIAHKKYDLIYFCAGGIKGGIKAVQEVNKDLKIITVDETKAVIESLKKDLIIGTVTQQPLKQGSAAINLAIDYLIYGKKPKKIINYTSNDVKLKNSFFREE